MFGICFDNRLNRFHFSVRHSHCCPMLALLGVLVTGSTLCRFHWLSLSTHCVAAFLHLVAVRINWLAIYLFAISLICYIDFVQVLLAIAVMFTFSGANDTFVYWCFWRRRKLPEGDTVSELLNATTMVESPQRKSLLSTEQHPSEGRFPLNEFSTKWALRLVLFCWGRHI